MAAWEQHIGIELRSESQLLPSSFENGMQIFKAPYGQDYEIIVRNQSDTDKFVAKACIEGPEGLQYLLLTKNNFKPLFSRDKAIFRGFQTKYEKENLEGEEVYRALQIIREQKQSRGELEKIQLKIYANNGRMTYNRGGGQMSRTRDEALRDGIVTVPGAEETEHFRCPRAKQRWESRQGKYLGQITIGVQARRDMADNLNL